ncbi:Mu transposase C-terminal domain-containing protein [Oceanobacillus kapialis]|uniref:Mu transposase C-terminal domain-containing protein n=1 Tax=Oceanobacillus kapialis TaxID=481353 RepID=UPI003850919F
MGEIYVNSVIEWSEKETYLERVLWVSPDKKEVVVIKIGEKSLYLPQVRLYEEIIINIETLAAKLISKEPYILQLNPSKEFVEKHGSRRDEAWEILKETLEIEPDIYKPKLRGILVNNIVEEHGVTKKWVYKMIKQYWTCGKTVNALLPLYVNSGGKGKSKTLSDKKIGRPPKVAHENVSLIGVNVKEDDKLIFKSTIRMFYDNKPKPDLKFAYEQMVRMFYHEGYYIKNGVRTPILPKKESVPTYRQFLYWFNKEHNGRDKAILKYGRREFNLKYRHLSSNATKRALGPGSIYEIDATIADVYLVSSLARHRIIGRPIVYIVKDVFSRIIAGVYVGLEGPSWLGAMMALENTSMNKREYCKTLGIDITDDEWPVHHLPSTIVADRGEMESKNADDLVSNLGIRIENTPPYRADLKGIVEQHFRTINTKIKRWIPGAVHKDFAARGGRDYRLDGKLTLKAVEKIIIFSILEHNQKLINDYPLTGDMIQSELNSKPVELWKWGLENRFGHLKEVDRDLIRTVTMPKGQASVRRGEVYFNKNYYSSNYFLEIGLFEEVAAKGSRKIEISYDPRSINQIYFQKDNGKFVRCELVNKFFDEGEEELQPRLEDLMEYYEHNHIKREDQINNQRQVTSVIDSQIKAVIDEETTKTNASVIPNQSNLSKTKSIRENRKKEKDYQRNVENWSDTLETSTTGKLAEVVDFDNSVEEQVDTEENPYFNILFNMDKEEGE